jgi:hypothetical protein
VHVLRSNLAGAHLRHRELPAWCFAIFPKYPEPLYVSIHSI